MMKTTTKDGKCAYVEVSRRRPDMPSDDFVIVEGTAASISLAGCITIMDVEEARWLKDSLVQAFERVDWDALP